MNAREIFDQLQRLDESSRIEAKRASTFGDSIMETICAFANEPGLDGGWLLLGVAQDENSLFPGFYTVHGIEDVDKMTRDISNACASTFNHPVRPIIQTDEIDGKRVVLVQIAESQPAEKPIYFISKGLPRGAFRRIGSTDQQCTEDDLLVFMDGRSAETYDTTIFRDATVDDFDSRAVEEYRTELINRNSGSEAAKWSLEDLLLATGSLRKRDGQLYPTVAGLVLFGKERALRQFLPTYRVDYIRIPGREWVQNPDQRFETMSFRGPAFQLIRRAASAILDDLPKSFSLEEGQLQRKDIPLIPAQVVREAVVNSIMHRSYRSHSPIQIIRYSNRIEIQNPGFSLKSPDYLDEPGSSPRNPHIAQVLFEAGFAETKGSGIRAMREQMFNAKLTPPTFESDRARDKFTARFLLTHFLSEENTQWLAQFSHLEISNDDALALVFVRETGAIDNASYRDLNKVDTLTASGRLRQLRDAGLLESKGKGSNTHYLPTPLFWGAEVQNTGVAPKTHKQNNSLNYKDKPAETHKLAGKSHKLSLLPPALQERLKVLPKRPGKDERESLIIELCQSTQWSAGELAELLNIKDPLYLQREYLKPLIKAGRLAYLHPEMPNHPRQAYMVAKKEPQS